MTTPHPCSNCKSFIENLATEIADALEQLPPDLFHVCIDELCAGCPLPK